MHNQQTFLLLILIKSLWKSRLFNKLIITLQACRLIERTLTGLRNIVSLYKSGLDSFSMIAYLAEYLLFLFFVRILNN